MSGRSDRVPPDTLLTAVKLGPADSLGTLQDGKEKWKAIRAVKAIGVARELLVADAQTKLMTKLQQKQKEHLDSVDVKEALTGFRIRDTILSQPKGAGLLVSPRESPIRQRKTQFYLKLNFEKDRSERNLQMRLDRGKMNAQSQKLMRLKRIQLANDNMHKHSLQNREQIWRNGISGTESAFFCSVDANSPNTEPDQEATQTKRDASQVTHLDYDTVEHE